ncbi:MAG: hypothetical protein U0231_00425 [Nitrospiraceae bacterium]
MAKTFSTQDFLDLQVWHNLAWFGYGSMKQFPRLAALRAKNADSPRRKSRKCSRSSDPTNRADVSRAQDRGQVELTTTPFFHPILPLVIDTEFTRRARPDLPLPARFHAPADAEAQIQRAVEYHTRTFGRAPAGLWPSEGSVCPEMFPILAKAGIRWLATDEACSIAPFKWPTRPGTATIIYTSPIAPNFPIPRLPCCSEDRDISDAFGFVYHKTTPDSAAEDVLRRVRGLAHDIPHAQGIIPVILDGENPWEHYHDGGERFLSLLFRAFEPDGLHIGHGIRVRTSTIGDALGATPPTQRLTQLTPAPGSTRTSRFGSATTRTTAGGTCCNIRGPAPGSHPVVAAGSRAGGLGRVVCR